MKAITTLFCSVSLILALGSGCKRAEKKRKGENTNNTDNAAAKTEAPNTAQPTPAHPAPAAANPHGKAPMPMVGGGTKADVKETAADGTKVLGPISIVVPKTWKETPPAGSMRLAQWTVGADKPAELVLFSFPGGGGVEANITRWVGQFTQEDGSSSKGKAVRKDLTIGGLPVTTLSVSGRFVAAKMPGAAEKHDAADYKMLASIVTVGDKAFFFKMVGPKPTLDAAEKDWNAMTQSIKKL